MGRERLVLASLVLVRASTVYLLLAALGLVLGAGGAILPWPAVAALLALSAAIQRGAMAAPWPEGIARGVVLAVAVAAAYLVLAASGGDPLWPRTLAWGAGGGMAASRTALSLAAALVAWAWGLRMAADGEYDRALASAFPVGLAAAIAAAALEAATPLELGAAPMALVIVAASMAGLALARAESLEARGRSLARLLATVGATVLLVETLAGALAGTPVADTVSWLLGAAGAVVRAIFALLMVPVELLLRAIFFVLGEIVRWLGGGVEFKPPELAGFEAGELQREVTRGEGLPGWLLAGAKWTVLAAVASGVGALLYRALWLGRLRPAAGPDEVREPLGDDLDPEEGGPEGGAARGRQAGAARYPLPAGDDPSTRVRRAYLRLLNLALEMGAPRHQWETPLEYAPRLSAGFPDAPVDRLTEAFLRVRFGGLEAPLQEAEELDRPVPSARPGRRHAI